MHMYKLQNLYIMGGMFQTTTQFSVWSPLQRQGQGLGANKEVIELTMVEKLIRASMLMTTEKIPATRTWRKTEGTSYTLQRKWAYDGLWWHMFLCCITSSSLVNSKFETDLMWNNLPSQHWNMTWINPNQTWIHWFLMVFHHFRPEKDSKPGPRCAQGGLQLQSRTGPPPAGHTPSARTWNT